jgi:hypothetical protein
MLRRSVLLVLCLSSHALGQTTFGTISGSIADSSGASVAGAAITVINADTGLKRLVRSGGDGNFAAPSLPPGPYSLEIEASGFKKEVRTGLELRVNGAIQVAISLVVGELKEVVQVSGEAPLLNTSNSTIGTVVTNETIVNMPLNGRQFTQLILLVPGTSPLQPPASAMSNNVSGISPAVNGGRPQNNNFTLDGVNNNEQMFNSFGVSPSVDAIQEFKIQSDIASAEFGKAAGANINISFRSGTNQLHGLAYEYFRNDKEDARNAFQPVRGHYNENQYGGTLGGPILIPKVYDGRNRTFFFFAAESFRERQGLTPPTGFVPTAAQLQGNLAGGAQIFDPSTTRTDANGNLVRDPFPGNQIPSNRIDRGASIIAQQFFPAPNLVGVPGVNVINPKNFRQDDDQWNLRVDQKIGSRNNLFSRFSLNNRQQTQPTTLPAIDGFLFNRNRNFVLSDTHVFNPTTILDAKFSFNRTYLATYNTALDPQALFVQTGLQGFVIQSQQFPMFPIFSISGYAGVAQDATLFGPLNTFEWVSTLTKIHGIHAFKAGADIQRSQFFTGSYRAGNIGFDSIPTSNPQSQANTGQSLASFLLGLPSSASRTVGDTNVRMRGGIFHFFVQDDIRVSRRLNLTFGLRYEYDQLPHDKYGRMSALDLRNGNILFASRNPITGQPANVRAAVTDPDWNNFAPRAGLAYSISKSTTFRLGYGIFYNSNFIQEQQGGRGQWPFALSQSDTNLNVTQPTRPLTNLFPVPPQSVIAFSGTRAIHGRTSYAQQWDVSLQRQIGQNLFLEADYVGDKGSKLYTNWRGNAATPGPGATAVVNARRPFPQYGTISEENPRASSCYDALELKLERRWKNGFTIMSSYTYSKSIDDSSALTNLSQNNPFDLHGERGLSEFDVRNNFVTTYVYELPFGPGKPFLSDIHGFAKVALAGWQVNGITSIRDGFPVKVIISTDTANDGVSGGQRPNLIGQLILPSSQRTPNMWFNTAALALPVPFTFGNLGRNVVVGPGLENFDFGAYKYFLITERHRLQFRADFFNLLNHVNLGQPGATFGNSTFAKISSTSNDARDIQFALRYQF